MKRFNLTEQICKYEEGNLNQKQTFTLFQYLVNTGDAWKLQGHYGRVAERLIEMKLIKPAKKTKKVLS